MRFDSSNYNPDVVRELGRIDLVAKVVAQGVYQGFHRSRRRGFSTEFSDFRPFTSNDDLRFLDWRLYARTDKLFVKCYEAETNLESHLLLDASRSMAWRWEDEVSKLEYGSNLLAALACVHIEHQDPIGLLVHDANNLHVLRPNARRRQLEEICALLSEVEPGSGDLFLSLVRELAAMKRHRGMIIICSDLEEDLADAERALRELSGREDELVLFHILDHAEISPPFTRASHLVDSETGETVPISYREMMRKHADDVDGFRDYWRTRCDECGIQYVEVHTRMSYVDVIHSFLAERELRR